MMVKICGITNLEDALAAAESGATALGFNFYPKSPRFISAESAAAIFAKLPPAVWKVGVFVDQPEALDTALAIGLDVVQFHGSEPPSALRAERSWKAFRVTSDFDWRLPREYDAEAVLLDGPSPGTGVPFDWAKVSVSGRKVIVAGGLDDTNVRQAIETARPWGVDACSKLETSPGRKDHKKMNRFVKAAL